MTPERLLRLRRLLGDALALPTDRQQAFVAAATDDDPALRREVDALLAAARTDDPRFEPLRIAGTDAPELQAGERIAAWRLVRRLGSGGMGDVWLAERADGAYSQQVAIKVPRSSVSGPTAFARFERERSLLAELEHPGAARLVDGGWTDTGRPWLAMEFVDGRPIDAHAAALDLDARDRVGLLLDACRALAAAHRARIVHRDLKPGNVLVRGDGKVVLVDFGIAAAPGTAAGGAFACLATPRYCAPEQLRGAPATTAADVYSLALVARELLGELADDDLRAVFAAAADPDVERRTASVDAFAAELQRWLDHLPVAARPPSPWRRLRMWRRRGPRTVAAVAVLTVSVLGLAVVSTVLWYGERRERQRAATALADAAQRFAQVRGLVADLVFGVHDRVAALPGAVPVRTFVIERAEQHLARLAAAAADDAELAQEWLAAQLRLADVRGTRTHGHSGDLAGALRSAAAAAQLAEAWHERDPQTFAWRLFAAKARRLAADVLRVCGRPREARSEYDLAQTLLTGATGDEAKRLAAVVELQLGKLDLDTGDAQAALARLAHAEARLADLAATSPDDRTARRDAALARSATGFALAQCGREAEAAAAWTTARAAFAALEAEHPDDAQFARDRIEVDVELAFAAALTGAPDAARRCEIALSEARTHAERDAANVLAQRLLERALLRSARVALSGRDTGLAAARYREAEPLLAATFAKVADDREVRNDLAEARIGRAEADRSRGRTDDVAATLRAGLELLDAEAAFASGDHIAGNLLTMAWIGLANLAAATGDLPTAHAAFVAARGSTAAWAERFPELPWTLRHLAILEHGLGCVAEELAADAALPAPVRMAHLEGAHAAFTRGQATAERLAAAGRLRGADAAMPKLFALDAQRVARTLAEQQPSK